MKKIVSVCKRSGFVYPNSEIYGGLSNSFDYGPLGVELLRNIKNAWWKDFVQNRRDMYGIDGSIISNPKTWEASGHISNFGDVMIDCRNCKQRFRADHFIFEQTGKDLEGYSLEEISNTVKNLKCSNCGKSDFTEAKNFNTLFKTSLGSVEDSNSVVYLRGETAQNMFLCYKNVLDSFSPKIPFGLGQIGKAFRNEITLGNFIFRTFEFEQMEIEYFVKEEDWEKYFEQWKKTMMDWLVDLGVNRAKLRWREHSKEALSHYSKRTEDIEYDFPFGGFKELYGLAYRTDFDLKQHAEFSGQNLMYVDSSTGEKFIPHVIEPTFGVSRTALTVLLDAYHEDGNRVVLKLDPRISPFKVAVFPLLSNKPELVAKAEEIFQDLNSDFSVAWDKRGNVGKRYYSQDEIGTPYCVTVDFETLEKGEITIRDRDTAQQIKVKVSELKQIIGKLLKKEVEFNQAGKLVK